MKAIYAFSGDPITYGHIDIVKRAAQTYDEVTVAIGENPSKTGHYLLTVRERLDLAKKCLHQFQNVKCLSFSGLLGEFAYRNDFDVIIRGVRNNSDLEGELVQFAVSQTLHPSVDTVFFPTRRQLSHISSGIVKAIVEEGGDVSDYCPLCVKERLEKKILGKFTVGVAGSIAAGKTYIAKKLVGTINQQVTTSYISLDEIGHHVLEATDGSIYQKTREKIVSRFGKKILKKDGTIDRQKLGKIVFSDAASLTELNQLMHEPMLARLYEETRETPLGINIIEGAILVEANWTNLVNNNVILVNASKKVRLKRLMEIYSISEHDALEKIERQISTAERKKLLEEKIEDYQWGRIWTLNNTGGNITLDSIAADIVNYASSS